MKALIVVDVQYDFMPATEEEIAHEQGGALAVPNGNEIIPVINKLLSKFELVIFTKDWHTEDMEAFAGNHKGKAPFDKYKLKDGTEDTLWPKHCIAFTPGARIHEDIDFGLIKGNFYIFKKGTESDYHPYSGFGGTELEDFLNEHNVHQVFICGLALDFCVKDTAIESALKGFETIVVKDGTRSIMPDITETLTEFKEAGVKIIDSWELPLIF